MSLATLNEADAATAEATFRNCCTAQRWVELMLADRPYSSADALRASADLHWSALAQEDYLEAFEGHPKIGDINSLAAKYASSSASAAAEQGAVNQADQRTLQALAQENSRYLQRFGFIFIVCASGKSAAEMLALLRARMDNDRSTELAIASEEQRKIFQLRLEKLL